MSRRRTSNGQSSVSKTSFVLPSVLPEAQKLLSNPHTSLDPSQSKLQSKADRAAMFFELSGAVLLNPEAPPAPASLVSRFVPALEKFLACHAINVHEQVDREVDAAKHAFVAQAKQAFLHFRDEVTAVSTQFEQWNAGLAQHLERQSTVRVISPGEQSMKVTQMLDRLRRLLDSLLERTKVLILQLQRSACDGARAAQPLLAYGDEMFAVTKGKKTIVTKLRGSKAAAPLDQVEKDREAWLQLWESSVDTSGILAEEVPLQPESPESPRRVPTTTVSRGVKREGYDSNVTFSAFVAEQHADSTHTSLEEGTVSSHQVGGLGGMSSSAQPPVVAPRVVHQTPHMAVADPSSSNSNKRGKFEGGTASSSPLSFLPEDPMGGDSSVADALKGFHVFLPPPPMDLPTFFSILPVHGVQGVSL